jgi:hypothetical protein
VAVLYKMVEINKHVLEDAKKRQSSSPVEPGSPEKKDINRVVISRAVENELGEVVRLLKEAGAVTLKEGASKIPRAIDDVIWEKLSEASNEVELSPSGLLRACLWRAAHSEGESRGKDIDILDVVLACLASHRQRATYAAVAPLVGSQPRGLMYGRPRSPLNSWVVSKATGKPTGYGDDEIDPQQLKSNPVVFDDPKILRQWLSERMDPKSFALLQTIP